MLIDNDVVTDNRPRAVVETDTDDNDDDYRRWSDDDR